jgi:hypothetical protein
MQHPGSVQLSRLRRDNLSRTAGNNFPLLSVLWLVLLIIVDGTDNLGISYSDLQYGK